MHRATPNRRNMEAENRRHIEAEHFRSTINRSASSRRNMEAENRRHMEAGNPPQQAIPLPKDFYSIIPDMEYAIAMFLIGFLIGFIRMVCLVPVYGSVVAGIIEIPLMLFVCFSLSLSGLLVWSNQHKNLIFMLCTSAYLAAAGNSAFHALVPYSVEAGVIPKLHG